MNTAPEQKITIDWKPDKSGNRPMYRQIVDYMSEMIASGHWAVGSRLPSQRSLAQQFGVNRSTITTAMEELSSYGVLGGDFGRGTYVTSNTWSLMMSAAPPDWGTYIRSGSFKPNVPTIQAINKLEFVEGYIRLGTGELAPELFPKKAMEDVLGRLSSQIPSLNYLGPLGLPQLREALARRLQAQGIPATPSSILITSGSLQALQLISLCMLQPGSCVYTESPSYLKSLQVFQSAGMKLHGLPMDNHGLVYWNLPPSSLQQGRSLLYTIPTFHNPTGTLMTQKRREELFRFCQNNRLPIIEDDAYGELWFDETPPKPMKTMDRSGLILYLGTISKTLAPGMRIGWLVGPETVIERLGDVKMQIDYGASSLSQWALKEFLESGLYDLHLTRVRQQLKKRRDLALNALNTHFGDIATWNIPQGSFYIWLRLPARLSTDRLFTKALEKNLLINPGSIYDYEKNTALRLSYAYAAEDKLEQGIASLAQVVRSML